jgi:hypothetical protein
VILTARDHLILELLGKYVLLTIEQVHELLFASTNKDSEQARRRLKLLKDATLIKHFDFKTMRGEYLFKLSERGLRQVSATERYREKNGKFKHTESVNDIAVALVKAGIPQTDIDPEPPLLLAGQERADLRIPGFLIEVDRGTASTEKLRLKLAAYAESFEQAWRRGWASYPRIVWIAPSEARVKLIQGLVDATATPELFWVGTDVRRVL